MRTKVQDQKDQCAPVSPENRSFANLFRSVNIKNINDAYSVSKFIETVEINSVCAKLVKCQVVKILNKQVARWHIHLYIFYILAFCDRLRPISVVSI